MKFKRKSPAQLQEKLEQMSTKKSYDNADEWKLATDKLGNGSALIRFLPSKSDDELPFVKIFNHGFKENGNWYIENCPSTIEKPCPVCAANGELWNTENEDNKKIARSRKRNLSYWANIVVLKDEANPENEGKVFKYRFGKKILDKITDAAQADEDLGVPGIDVTCVFEGANFSLKAKKVSGFPNYDESKFGPSVELYNGDEEKLEQIWNDMHDLGAIIAPSEFKSEEELQRRFLQVTAPAKSGSKPASASDSLREKLNSSASSKPADEKPVKKESPAESSTDTDDYNIDAELDALMADLEED